MGGVIHITLLLILYSLLAAAPCSLLTNETEDSAFLANSRALITRLIGGIYCLEGGASPLGDFASQSHYPHAWERTPSYAPAPGYLRREQTPLGYSPSPNHEGRRPTTPHRASSNRGNIFRDTEWDYSATDNEEHQSPLHYTIEWRVTLNNRVVAKDTEQDLALDPDLYWQDIWQKAETILRRKVARNRRVRLDDTTVVVSVNNRSQRDLTNRFEKTNIN
jgi:hypothetical protein